MPRSIALLAILFSHLTYFAFSLSKPKECSKYTDALMKKDPEDYVNILGGTDSRYDISHGSTLPLISRPWGFNSYAPQTDDDPNYTGWWFHPSDRRFFGLRVTHQPSPWIADYGNFLIKAYMPTNPADKSASQDAFTGFSPKKSIFSPYYFSTSFYSYGNTQGNMKFEFVPSRRGGIVQASFPSYITEEEGDDGHVNQQIRRISLVLSGKSDSITITKSPIDGTTMISGYTKVNSGGVGDSNAAFAHYFVAMIYCGENGMEPTTFDATTSHIQNNQLSYVDFSPNNPAHDKLTIRFATSFISIDQALQTLQYEVFKPSFSTLYQEAKTEWHNVLSRVLIKRPAAGYSPCEMEELYTIFYSSLYRASLFPRQLSEVTATGQVVHWSPYTTSATTRVQPGPLSTDSGFWDAWNTIYPLLALVNRPVLGTTIQGWLSAYQEGGWLPKWASPGYRGSMIGTMGDVSLGEAIVNDIPGFNVTLAYEAILKDAFVIPPVGVDGVGRVCLAAYLQWGFIPTGSPMTTGGTCYEIVSRSLNYYQSDYAISQAAAHLGHTEDATILAARAKNYSQLFDQQTGFFRSRLPISSKRDKEEQEQHFTEPFDQFAWGGDYTEAGPWQYRLYVPHDPEGLQALYKSRNASSTGYCPILQTLSTMTSLFHIGNYGSEIHEQTELADHCYGQYAHNNQPSHYLWYMSQIEGLTSPCAQQGRQAIRQVLETLYTADADMFPGDEDNGEMGGWFVLSAMGLYARAPGSGQYVLGIPLFEEIEIDISDTPVVSFGSPSTADLVGSASSSPVPKVLRIVAEGNHRERSAVHQVRWNNELLPLTSNEIPYAKLAQGGTLTFQIA